MATLIDHMNKINTHGTVENLTSLMESSLMSVSKFRPTNHARYVASSVRAAIRRQGITDARQELIMSDSERAAWLAANPLPEN